MRILGIDIGSRGIKAVEVETSFSRFEILEYHEKNLKPTQDDPYQKLSELVAGLAKTPDRMAISLSTSHVTFRSLGFPIKDKKAIRSAILFELEDDLPFPLTDAIFDYSLQMVKDQEKSRVFVQITLKKYLEDKLKQLHDVGVDPDLITSETWAYRTLANRIPEIKDSEKPVLILNVGFTRSTMHVFWKGFPIMDREVPWGGKEINQALVQKYDLPKDESENTKLVHGFLLNEDQKKMATPEQVDFANTLFQPLLDLIWEIRQLECSLKGAIQQGFSMVYTTGGTTLLQGFDQVFEDHLRVPVRPLRALSQVGASGVAYSEATDATCSLALALALSLIGSEKANAINFRKEIFSKSLPQQELRLHRFKRPAISIALILLCYFSSFYLRKNFYYQPREAEVVRSLEKNIKQLFPDINDKVIRTTYLANPKSLQDKLDAFNNSNKTLAHIIGPNSRSPALLLKNISSEIPNGIVVDLIHFKAAATLPDAKGESKETASMSFLVNQQDSIKKLSQILKSKLNSFEESEPEVVPASENMEKRWKVTFKGSPTEKSYAQ